METEFTAIEKKWQHEWDAQKVFQPELEDKPKCMLTFPYPYVNGLPHVGHLFTMMRVEALARYKRAKGFNVLFPQGWHATGSPIVTAALRVREGDEKQLQILRDFGIPEADLHKFEEPEHWIEHFVPEYKKDVQRIGMSVDWRREFVTTSMNPHYDKFIKWQFEKLKEKGYVEKGKHPVVWCAKEQVPISDHDRRSGEGETPQEFVLVFFKLKDMIVPCATLRPETMPGLTNLWLHPDEEYIITEVDNQKMLLAKSAVDKLRQQEHSVKEVETVRGETFIGKQVTSPTGAQLPILPATFVSLEKGTGIVMSVPSDAPDDYIALRDIKQHDKLIEKYNLELDNIKPIAIIDAPELGDLAAVTVVEEWGIKNQNERKKLDEAKKLVYKKGFYEGVMIAGPYKGEKVEYAKEKVREDLLEEESAMRFWELTGPVICRCGQQANVRIVADQWFITYSNPDWKIETHNALDNMNLYPPKAHAQFDYVIDWLHDRACARDKGLGTRLPWDNRWVIEALSDSTLYNSYYTYCHILQKLPEDEITSELFDYVYYETGTPKDDSWKQMRELYEYWYPVDFRNSGKDLIQNHLTFMLFIHTALLPEDKWPTGYGINGWVTVDGQKMSKSLGNMIPVRDMLKVYGADASRLTILNGGEGMDDPNWDTKLAQATSARIKSFMEFCKKHSSGGRSDAEPIDDWLVSNMHRIVYETTQAMERAEFRTALQFAWFELSNVLKKYVSITIPNESLMREAIETQLKLLQPFVPHTCEEVWHAIGNHGFISLADWPTYDSDLINLDAEEAFRIVEDVQSDVRRVQELANIDQPRKITLIVATSWKHEFVKQLKQMLQETYNPGEIIKSLMQTDLKQHGQHITKLVPRFIKNQSLLPNHILGTEKEMSALQDASRRLELAFGASIEVLAEHETDNPKASGALPGKPAILLE